MQFDSIEFFIFLITILLLINSLKKLQYQQAILLAGSFLFYWATSNYFVILLLFIIITSYNSGSLIFHAISPIRKKITLVIAIFFLLIPLVFFKYYNFGVELIHQIPLPLNYYLNLPVMDIILPIGISFFTFSAISYVIDIYRGAIHPEEKFYRYALFVSYFPHLLAGPIVRASQFLPQLKHCVSLSPDTLKTGTTIMVWGFLKKFVIADNLSPIVTDIFSHPVGLSSPYIVLGTFLFGIQIYCDFSGYIDIALGVAEMIGLHLPQNFFRPYLSKSPTEFWRRWNITLSSFIRDYIYIPLGGNRLGKIRTYLNLEMSMLLCGLWHGAAWNFIIWGGYHGLLLSIHKFGAEHVTFLRQQLSSINSNFLQIVKIFITQYFIFLGWIIFRVGDLPNLLYCINKYVLFDFDFSKQKYSLWGVTPLFDIINSLNIQIKTILFLFILCIIIIIVHSDSIMKKISHVITTDWTHFFSSLPIRYWIIYLTIILFVFITFRPGTSPLFIYFQF